MPYKNPMDFSIGPKHITKYTTNHIFLSKYTSAHYTLHTPKSPISFNSFEKSRAAVIQSIKDTNHCGRARRSRNTCPTRYSCSSGCCSSWYFRLELRYLAQPLGCYQNLRPLGCGNSWLSWTRHLQSDRSPFEWRCGPHWGACWPPLRPTRPSLHGWKGAWRALLASNQRACYHRSSATNYPPSDPNWVYYMRCLLCQNAAQFRKNVFLVILLLLLIDAVNFSKMRTLNSYDNWAFGGIIRAVVHVHGSYQSRIIEKRKNGTLVRFGKPTFQIRMVISYWSPLEAETGEMAAPMAICLLVCINPWHNKL